MNTTNSHNDFVTTTMYILLSIIISTTNLKNTCANKHRHPAGDLKVFVADRDDSFAMFTVKYLSHTYK